MAVDMSQFYQVFFEEAQEHLANMEGQLLELDLGAPDAEQLNAIFRAAHSIKGGAATFGFQDMAEVTHVLETMLDRVRKGELAMTSDMVDAALVAGDVLKAQLAAHRGEGEADTHDIAEICARLRVLAGAESNEQALKEGCGAVDAKGNSAATSQEVATTYEIRFEVAPHAIADAHVTENLLTELGQLGAVDIVQAATSPSEPGWQIRLSANIDLAEVEGLLDFVAVPGSVQVLAPGQAEAKVVDDSFGLFDQEAEPPAVLDDGAFGLFEPLPSDASRPAEPGDDSFGLFVGLPAPETPKPAPALVAIPLGKKPVEPKVAETPRPREPATKAHAADSSSIRVGVDKVDQLINLVGELVITQAMLAQSAAEVDPVAFERLFNGLAQLERNTRDLQESVMSIRMMPISVVFSRFPRVVRDLSQKLGKQVDLKTSGESTELDKGLIERITDPLTHLVRNSIDHGIELPEARIAVGKTAHGSINLRASQQSGNIVIEVSDDGAGLQRDRILAKARQRGLAASDSMTDQDVWQLIFEPGFSTADQVTEVSGRGVGMDVVKKNVAALGGRIDIESMAGIGTRITVRLPLTLAILDGMSIAVGGQTFVIPLNHVVESLQPKRAMLKSISGSERLIQVRGEYLPLVALHDVFGIKPQVSEVTQGIAVILEADGTKAALLVDALVGEQQVVIKSLEANYRRIPGVAAATILGDGKVGLILDVTALVATGKSRTRDAA
ncbi:MAG: chemotaxis protein CheW [Rhodocyclaceae bacterium]